MLRSVVSYDTNTARLTIEHRYPVRSQVQAVIDVTLLLQNLKVEQTDYGQWVNVIGYITSKEGRASLDSQSKPSSESHVVGIQALVLWVAQGLDVGSYEESFATTGLLRPDSV